MISRYDKHIKLKGFGEEGQNALSGKSVVIIGCGALGTNISNLLARAGVGKILIVDRDIVEIGNLHRQVLFSEEDIGTPKSVTAAGKLKKTNSEIVIEPLVKDIKNTNIEGIIKGFDLILDATDNISTRMLINDVSLKTGIPWIYGGVLGTSGMIMNIVEDGPCLRCMMPEIPPVGSVPTCESEGVLNTIPSVVASIQSTEALKILMGRDHQKGLIRYDIWDNNFVIHKIDRDQECECCGKGNYKYLNMKREELVTVLCDDSIQIISPADAEIDLKKIAENLKIESEILINEYLIRFKTEGKEVTVYRDGRVIIKGTEDKGVAKSIYSRYLG
ncbi:MAG: ThiF family adenylyltransferase [Acidobacteriota bacterium]